MNKTTQFNFSAEFEETCRELGKALIEAQNAVSRMLWLKDDAARQYAAMQAAADALEIFTEAEAAELLKIEPAHLATMRRNLDLPHCSFGNKPRYTKAQLIRITEILEINSKNKK